MQDDLYCSTALVVSCENGHVDVARLLIERGAAIDYQNKVRAVVTVKKNAHFSDKNCQSLFL